MDAVWGIVGTVIGTIVGFLLNYLLEARRACTKIKKMWNALRIQALNLPRINQENITATEKIGTPKHLVPILYPIALFESSMSPDGITVSEGTADAVNEYLLKAVQLNSIVTILQMSHLEDVDRSHLNGFLYDQAKKEMSERIQNLKSCIETEKPK